MSDIADDGDADKEHAPIGDDNSDIQVTDEEILNALEKPFSGRELLFADTAIATGVESGVFKVVKCDIDQRRPAPTSAEDMEKLQTWEVIGVCDRNAWAARRLPQTNSRA